MREYNHNKSNKDKDVLYKCHECGFWYKEEKWAEKCEAWCKKHKSCNLEITKHSLRRTD